MIKDQERARSEQMLALTIELKKESDRAVAVLAAGYLDHLLGDLIASKMAIKPDKVEELLYRKGHGPLGSFSARIDMTYCLGFLNENEYKDLHRIRDIRNDFAHKLIGLSFKTQNIADRCRALKGAQVGGQPSSARECFRKAAIRLMVDLILRIQNS